jgi:Predicted transcriptional regulators
MTEKILLGELLTKLRNSRGLTQDKVAADLEIKRARYNSWENNIAKPDNSMLIKLANYFKVTTDYILGNECKTYEDTENILELLHKRPELKALFSISKNASKEDIEQAMKIIKALKK